MDLAGFPIKKRFSNYLVLKKLNMMIKTGKLIYEPLKIISSLSAYIHLKILGTNNINE
jgi:hypothetical protein